MPSILFVCLHRPDRSPSQRFRFEQYIPILQKAGYQTRFSFLLDSKSDKKFYQKGQLLSKFGILFRSILLRFRESFIQKPADIVFVQRECFMLGTAFFEKRFSQWSKLIFDFDDSIWMQNVSEGNRLFAFLKDAGKTRKIIAFADLVFAGNDYLAQYARKYNQKVYIVPTTIDTDVYQLIDYIAEGPVRIGWSGSFTTIQHFQTAIPALSRIKNKYEDRVQFIVIGDKNYSNEELGIKGQAWNLETELTDLRKIDIGIMPLPDDEWAKGKCGLKGLQYMALGIPTIMSPVGVNNEIIQDGENGFLVSSQLEWVDKLSLLIESVELRRKLGSNGRRTVEEKYSVKANAPLYLELFNSLIAH
jgi:glycosyltransferase involved in cell wall biosynthesis